MQLLDQLVVPQQKCDLDRRGVRVVRGLRHIQSIMWIQELIFAFLMSRHLQRNICKDLVGIHVRGCPRTSLVPVDLELIVVLAVAYGLAGLFDGLQCFWLHGAYVRVCPGRRQFDDRPSFDEPRIVIDLNP